MKTKTPVKVAIFENLLLKKEQTNVDNSLAESKNCEKNLLKVVIFAMHLSCNNLCSKS